MAKVFIGVDPHRLSATIEVVDKNETVLATGRFGTDKAGYAAMRKHVASWPEPIWAVEDSNGTGRPLAQRLLADGEHVVDVSAKLSARARLFDTGHNRKTDAHDAHAVAVVAVRTKGLRVLSYDEELEVLRMPVHRREELTRAEVQSVNRLQRLLSELLPGQSKKDQTSLQAKRILTSVRPGTWSAKPARSSRSISWPSWSRSRPRSRDPPKSSCRWLWLPGSSPTSVTSPFADRNGPRLLLIDGTGTAALDASFGEQNRHRLSRAGNHRMNHRIHVAAISQVRLDTEGRAYYLPKRSEGKKPLEAITCLERRISDAIYRPLLEDAMAVETGPRGHCGASQESSVSDLPPHSTLRISHFPAPHNRRYARPLHHERGTARPAWGPLVASRREPI